MNSELCYCAIKSRFCKARQRECKANSTFVAYSFETPFTEIVSEVGDYLRGISIEANIPQSSNTAAGMLFCDIICPMILDSEIVVGEVSSPNRNVFLEIGYAVGADKKILLLSHEKFRKTQCLFSELGFYVNQYKYAGEIVKAVNEGNAKLMLELDDSIVQESASASVLFADPETQLGSLQDVTETVLEKKSMRVVEDVGSAHGSERVLRKIAASEWVIAVFVGENYRDHSTLNSRVAFYLGIALSTGKKVVVLQQLPEEKMMIDLAGVVERFSNISQVRDILMRRLDERKTRILEPVSYTHLTLPTKRIV